MEDSQAAACSGQSPGTRAQLRPAASCLLCSTQALSGQKSCTINPMLMWPGMVTALPVTAGTARLWRPSLLRWVVSLKTLLFYTGWGTWCVCASLCHAGTLWCLLCRCLGWFLPFWEAVMYLGASQNTSVRAGLCKHSGLARHRSADVLWVWCLFCQLRWGAAERLWKKKQSVWKGVNCLEHTSVADFQERTLCQTSKKQCCLQVPSARSE